MNINITSFFHYNVIDSCSIWNILSSERIYYSSLSIGCDYSMTQFVEYECLYKPRKSTTIVGENLKNYLKQEISRSKFKTCNLSIDDLQDIQLLQNRKKLGIGELSSIAFAKKTGQAFLTDDKTARKLGNEVLGRDKVQTTPHLVGYLFYKNRLVDGDLKKIIQDHNKIASNNWSKLDRFFQQVYEESMRIKLYENSKGT